MQNHASSPFNLGPALGLLMLRIWLGVRAFLTGIEKFAGEKGSQSLVTIDGAPNTYGLTESASEKFFSLAN